MAGNDIVNGYFAAYKAGEYEKLSAYFHPEFEFSDPAFPDLKGKRAKAMFHMFCSTRETTQLVVTPSLAESIPGEDAGFRVQYSCDYVFGASKNKVHNDITGIITVRDGKVKRHADSFDTGAWGVQALGWLGSGLSAIGILDMVVKRRASQRLDDWCERNPEFK